MSCTLFSRLPLPSFPVSCGSWVDRTHRGDGADALRVQARQREGNLRAAAAAEGDALLVPEVLDQRDLPRERGPSASNALPCRPGEVHRHAQAQNALDTPQKHPYGVYRGKWFREIVVGI